MNPLTSASRNARNKRFLKGRLGREEMSLQITSMADIFTIILVFLLKSFSTGVSNITPGGILLPVAFSADEVVDMLKIEIAPDHILVDDKVTTTLSAFKFVANDLESNGTPRSLNAALIVRQEQEKLSRENQRGRQREVAETDEPQLPRLMILADQKTPYSTLKAVMTSASRSGFGDFKLVVVEDQ